MRLSSKLCTDIINYGCNKPKLPRQWCRGRTGPAAPSCPKAHLTPWPFSSTAGCCSWSQKKLSTEWYLHIFSSPPLVCHATASQSRVVLGVPAVKRFTASSGVLRGRASYGSLEMMANLSEDPASLGFTRQNETLYPPSAIPTARGSADLCHVPLPLVFQLGTCWDGISAGIIYTCV